MQSSAAGPLCATRVSHPDIRASAATASAIPTWLSTINTAMFAPPATLPQRQCPPRDGGGSGRRKGDVRFFGAGGRGDGGSSGGGSARGRGGAAGEGTSGYRIR